MNSDTREVKVQHNPSEGRFEATVDGKLCVAEYALRHGEFVMTHTLVPPELRGRGIAEKLVRTALEFAREDQRRVVPACSYVDIFIRRHPEFQGLVD